MIAPSPLGPLNWDKFGQMPSLGRQIYAKLDTCQAWAPWLSNGMSKTCIERDRERGRDMSRKIYILYNAI